MFRRSNNQQNQNQNQDRNPNPEIREEQKAENGGIGNEALADLVENELNLAGNNAIKGAIRKSEGIVKGVADLILLIPRHGFHGLMIEMKTPDGYWRKDQQEWAALVRAQGYRYEVIRTEDDFITFLAEYLKK